jgi:hypothetical protein
MLGVTKHFFLRAVGYVVLNYRTLELFDQYVQNPASRRAKARKHKLSILGLKHIRARPPVPPLQSPSQSRRPKMNGD